jgi:phage-related tail fiber protein
MAKIEQRDIMFRAVGGQQLADTLDLSAKTLTLPSAVQQLLVPSGMIAPFAGSSAPSGWLACEGALVNRADYHALFTAIGTTYGAGNGTTTFMLPDLRGEFLRGWDNGRGVDASRARGSTQGQDWKGFWMTNTVQVGYAYSHNDVYMGKSLISYIGNLFTGGWSAPAAAIGTKWDSSEIRPRNLALLFCIKT